MNLQTCMTVGRICLMDNDGLKTWRENYKLTQDQLAKKLNVAANTVSRWELGTRKIPEFLELALKQIASELKDESDSLKNRNERDKAMRNLRGE